MKSRSFIWQTVASSLSSMQLSWKSMSCRARESILVAEEETSVFFVVASGCDLVLSAGAVAYERDFHAFLTGGFGFGG